MRLDKKHNGFKIVAIPLVVSIKKRNCFPSGFCDSSVSGCRDSGIFLTYYPDSVVPDFCNFVDAVVGRSVVNDYNLEILKCLV